MGLKIADKYFYDKVFVLAYYRVYLANSSMA